MTYFDQTEPIMTSLTTFMLINLTKITFETVLILCIIKWDKFGHNRSFLVKMVKIGSCWGQNAATGQNLGQWAKYFLKTIREKFISPHSPNFDI